VHLNFFSPAKHMLKFCGAAAVLAWRSVAEIHYKTKCVFEWFSRQKFQNLHSLLKTFSLTFFSGMFYSQASACLTFSATIHGGQEFGS
jgi:hypothetical protein